MRIILKTVQGEIIPFLHDGSACNYVDVGDDPEPALVHFRKQNPLVAYYEIDTDYETAQAKKQQYSKINQKYLSETANIREAIRQVLDTGKDATDLRAKLAAKQAQWKNDLLGV